MTVGGAGKEIEKITLNVYYRTANWWSQLSGADLGEAAEQQGRYFADVCHKKVTEGLGATVGRQRQQDPVHHVLQHGVRRHVHLLDDAVHCEQQLQLPLNAGPDETEKIFK